MRKQRIVADKLTIEMNYDLDKFLNQQKRKFHQEAKAKNQKVPPYIKELFRENFYESLKKRFTDFVICVNIAYPGFFEVSKAVFQCDGQQKLDIDKSYLIYFSIYILNKKIFFPLLLKP